MPLPAGPAARNGLRRRPTTGGQAASGTQDFGMASRTQNTGMAGGTQNTGTGIASGTQDIGTGGASGTRERTSIFVREHALRILDHASTSRQTMLDQLGRSKMLNGLSTFDEHLWTRAPLSVQRKPRRDEQLHFSTTSEISEEKCGARTRRILSTFEPFRELSTDFFAATSLKHFLMGRLPSDNLLC